MGRSKVFYLVVGFGAFGGTAAFGNVIAPGTILASPDIFTGQAGLTLVVSKTSPYSTTNFSGSVTTAVFRDPNNVFGAGDFDFLYQITSNGGSTTSLNTIVGTAFTGFLTDVGYRADGGVLPGGLFVNGSVVPIGVGRNGGGDAVAFNFQSPGTSIAPGQTSDVLVIATNSTNYAAFPAAIQALTIISDGTIGTTAAAFQPAAVPEPGSIFLFCCGTFIVGFRRFLWPTPPR